MKCRFCNVRFDRRNTPIQFTVEKWLAIHIDREHRKAAANASR